MPPPAPFQRDIWDFPRIFQPPIPGHGEQVFYAPFTPARALHREAEIARLTSYFQERLLEMSQNYSLAVISGSVGQGKGLLVKTLHQQIHKLTQLIPELKYRSLHWIRLSCRQYKPAEILCEILRNTQPSFLTNILTHPTPGRNFIEEVWIALILAIQGHNLTVFLELKDIEHYTGAERASLFDFCDQFGSAIHVESHASLNVVIATTDSGVAEELSAQITLDHLHLQLPPYSQAQRVGILQVFAEAGLQEGAYDLNVLRTVEALSHKFSDVRYAIDLLWRAAKLAGDDEISQITEAYVVQAFQVERNIVLAPILEFTLHQQLYLYRLARLLHDPTTPTITTSTLRERYNHYCEEYDLKPRTGTTLYDYLQEFERLNLIERHVSKPGTVSSLKLKGVSANEIISLLTPVIDQLKENVL